MRWIFWVCSEPIISSDNFTNSNNKSFHSNSKSICKADYFIDLDSDDNLCVIDQKFSVYINSNNNYMCLSRCKTVKKQGKNLSLNNNQASKEPDSNGSNSNDSKKVIQQSLNANHDKLFEITDNHIDRNSKESEFEVSRVKIEDQDFYDNL